MKNRKLLIIIFTLLLALHWSESSKMKNFNKTYQTSWVRKDNLIQSHLRKKNTNSEDDKVPATGNETINLEVIVISNNVLQFILRENGKNTFELPKREPFPFHKFVNGTNVDKVYDFIVEENPFSITVTRKATGEEIFSSRSFNIIFLDNYAEITTKLPSKFLFGLGERTTNFRLQPGTYTIYNKNNLAVIDGGKGAKQRYGSHPMYLMREKNRLYHIVYLRNSFPMDAIVKENGDSYELTFKIAGGVLDFSIFFGDENPETATKMYHNFLDKYSIPPFWGMGFNQGRWGYKNLTMVKEVLDKYKEHKLPLDTIWMDIDYMDGYVPFTVDEKRFDLAKFKLYLEEYKKKFMLITEPSMAIKWPDYEFLVKGKELDIFIKTKEGKYIMNRVWPGDCYFIDYFHPNTSKYWNEALDKLYEKINYSGIWLDMNELATFEPGQINEEDDLIPCNDDTKYPYYPSHQKFESKTICPNAIHYGGNTHIQLHNYLPVMQQMLSYRYLEKKFPDEFPYVMTRSNSAGSGKFSAHWSGDNKGNYEFYKRSLGEVFNYNIFGIPMVGADICGFFPQKISEVFCAKFYQYGSLFPFSRSHTSKQSIRKEPWFMGPTLLETTRKSLKFRYEIIKYYYSLFIAAGGAGTLFRPLFFNFHDKEDDEILNDKIIESQFMIGEELMSVPNFNEDETTTLVKAYFPTGLWFDLRYNKLASNKRSYKDVDVVLLEMPPVFLRGGKTIFTNNAENVLNTFDLDNNFNFLIAFDENFESSGKIPALMNYGSKSKVNDCIKFNCFCNIRSKYDVLQKKLMVKISQADFYDTDYKYMTISKLQFFGMKFKDLIVDQSNLDEIIQLNTKSNGDQKGTTKFSIELINENSFIIHINGKLKMKRKSLDIFVKFK